jgi:predicted TIM-barrel fold metal-dependent hydrolase
LTFTFSADGHVLEPKDLFTANLPPKMLQHGIRSERRDEHMVTLSGSREINRIPLHKPVPREVAEFGRKNRLGMSDLNGRLADMKDEGIDAEIVFPSTGLWTFLIEEPEVEAISCRTYNDWIDGYFAGHLDKFIRCAILPVRDFSNTLAEMKRIAAKGFTAAMLPSVTPIGAPQYNDEAWDPIFEAGQELGIVFVLHTGTGQKDVREWKGGGGAVINYTIQMAHAQTSLLLMTASGLLDRFPGAQVAVIESGASWLAALAERMDEVYQAHQIFVRPKLSVLPSEIVKRQISASFQYDRACVMSRSVTGTRALMWGSDYPHHEGTFPNSRHVVAHLFDGIDISEQEKADILGGNAARLFRLQRPEFMKAA